MVDQGAWQLRRQWRALGLLLRRSGGRLSGQELGQLRLHGGQVGVDQFFQQLPLHALELLAAPGELVALEQRQLMGLFLDHRVAVADRFLLLAEDSVFLGEDAICTLHAIEQLGGQSTELIGGEGIEVGARSHDEQYAKPAPDGRLDVRRIANRNNVWLQHRDHRVGAQSLPGQALHQGVELLVGQA